MTSGTDQPIDPRLEAAFTTVSATRAAGQRGLGQPIAFAHLVLYLEGSDQIDRELVESALGEQLPLRRLFKQLLAQRSSATMLSEARADDGSDVAERECSEFTLIFRPSRADPEQAFVIFRPRSGEDVFGDNGFLLVAELDDTTTSIEFPQPQDGQAQLLLPRDDGRVAVIKNPQSMLSVVRLP